MKKIIMAGIAITILAAAPAQAFMPGKDLNRYCQDGPGSDRMACYSWIDGAVNGIEFGASVSKGTLKPFCVPKGVTLRQVGEIVKKWLGDHPEEWHQSAVFGVASAMRDAFPCR